MKMYCVTCKKTRSLWSLQSLCSIDGSPDRLYEPQMKCIDCISEHGSNPCSVLRACARACESVGKRLKIGQRYLLSSYTLFVSVLINSVFFNSARYVC
jgi:hypothetical protein